MAIEIRLWRSLRIALILAAAMLPARAIASDVPMAISLDVAAATKLPQAGNDQLPWRSSDPAVAQVFPGGWVAGLSPGHAKITAESANQNCIVTVTAPESPLVDPSSLKQFPGNRRFTVDGRECYGSELNGRRTTTPQEHAHTRSNRVINPHPLRADKPLDWQVQANCEVFDGAGVLMGTVAPTLGIDGAAVPVSMFNFGMSKVLHGRLCVYGFSVRIKPSREIARLIDPKDLENGTVGTSAWLPLDRVMDSADLLERIGLGKVSLPRLPLEETRYRITGGDPNHYRSRSGEMSIVRNVSAGPVPSHYLRRPSGTVNIIYSVPGFGLGGQGLDSFLVSDGLIFRPARGAKIFVQPTYYPAKDPRAGKVSPMTETFLYGAVEVRGRPPVYGWIAKEALAN